MKKFMVLLGMAATLMSCQQKGVTLNFTVKDKNIDSVGVYLAKIDTMIAVDGLGKASVTIPLKDAEYGMLQYKFKNSPVYLEPGQNINVTWDMTPSELTIAFEGGNADKNSFINGKELKGPLMGDFGRKEHELLKQLEDYQNEDFKILESKNFDKTFTEREKERIVYWVYGMLCQYAQGTECSDATYDKLKSLIKEEAWLPQLSEYTNFMGGAIALLANREANGEPDDIRTENAMKYTIENIKTQDIKDYLLGMYAISYVQNNGINQASAIKEMVESNVKDPEILAAFASSYESNSGLAQGMPSPDFKMTSIDGKEYTLADFKGKVIYIDVWATWCAPCKEEIPHLKNLEEMFQGSNITFVSMSIDQDKAAWEKMVKEEKLGGIQLYAGPTSEFCDAYKITGIPHFILIDKEGKIIESHMSRPSEERTIEALGMVAEGEE